MRRTYVLSYSNVTNKGFRKLCKFAVCNLFNVRGVYNLHLQYARWVDGPKFGKIVSLYKMKL